jgi:hypothetical protein
MAGTSKAPVLHTGTALARGMRELFKQLGERLSLYIGAPEAVSRNIEDAVTLARRVQAQPDRNSLGATSGGCRKS